MFNLKNTELNAYFLMGSIVIAYFNVSDMKTVFAEVGRSITDSGWREIQFADKKANHFVKCGQDCIKIDSASSVSMIRRSLKIDITEKKFLSWEWKLTAPPAPSDLEQKGQDDRPLAVYITFPFDKKNASISERGIRHLVELRYGKEAPGRVLSYVWASTMPIGEAIESPFGGSQHKMIIKRNGASKLNTWLGEKVDVFADYKNTFGVEPEGVLEILISSDTDDTQSVSSGFVRRIQFSSH